LQTIYDARTQYVVPSLEMEHDVPLRIKIEGLESIPEKSDPEESDKPEKQPGESIDYDVDVGAMEGFIEDVTLTENDDVYVRFNTASAIQDFKVDLGNGLQSATKEDVGGDF